MLLLYFLLVVIRHNHALFEFVLMKVLYWVTDHCLHIWCTNITRISMVYKRQQPHRDENVSPMPTFIVCGFSRVSLPLCSKSLTIIHWKSLFRADPSYASKRSSTFSELLDPPTKSTSLFITRSCAYSVIRLNHSHSWYVNFV